MNYHERLIEHVKSSQKIYEATTQTLQHNTNLADAFLSSAGILITSGLGLIGYGIYMANNGPMDGMTIAANGQAVEYARLVFGGAVFLSMGISLSWPAFLYKSDLPSLQKQREIAAVSLNKSKSNLDLCERSLRNSEDGYIERLTEEIRMSSRKRR